MKLTVTTEHGTEVDVPLDNIIAALADLGEERVSTAVGAMLSTCLGVISHVPGNLLATLSPDARERVARVLWHQAGRYRVGEGAAQLECHKLDTPTHVFFYEQEFYVLSNFSAFALKWKGQRFDTAEHAYHWEKFTSAAAAAARWEVLTAASAHDAFKAAQRYAELRRPDWDEVKVDIMREILFAKVEQHPYVKHKLLATGDRKLVEDSWRDDFWGWGQNRDGKNMLGRLWMEIRDVVAARETGVAQG
jgi:ribA/ribD-fused uncharacterized protein